MAKVFNELNAVVIREYFCALFFRELCLLRH